MGREWFALAVDEAIDVATDRYLKERLQEERDELDAILTPEET